MNPRLLGLQQVIQRIDGDFSIHQHRNTVADGKQGSEIVGDDDDRDTQALVKLLDQRIDAAGDYRVETGGRFIEKKYPRIQRQCSRQRRTLDHAARKARRET